MERLGPFLFPHLPNKGGKGMGLHMSVPHEHSEFNDVTFYPWRGSHSNKMFKSHEYFLTLYHTGMETEKSLGEGQVADCPSGLKPRTSGMVLLLTSSKPCKNRTETSTSQDMRTNGPL